MATTSIPRHIGNAIAGFFCIGVAGYALSYLFIAHGFLSFKGETANSPIWQMAFRMHFLGGAVALGVGWTQFLRRFRNRRLAVHRLLGKVYVISILLISAPASIYMASVANGGFNNVMGFGMMGIIWFGFTLAAYINIRKGDVDKHEKWMIRSFAVTLAAVALRLWMPIMIMSGIPEPQAYQAVAWLCWVPNLFVAEWVIMRKQKS